MNNAHNPYASPNPDAAAPPPGPFFEGKIDANEAVIAEGALTYEDFLQANKLHRGSRRWLWVFIVVFLMMLFTLGFLVAIKDGDLGPLAIAAGLTGLITFCLFWLPRRSASRLWNIAQSLREPIRRVITQEVIQTLTSQANVTLRWSNYCKYRHSDDVVLLYLADHPPMFIIFTRRTFHDDAGWKQFRTWVSDKLPPA